MSAVKKICVVSGGFDPIHSGHIDYINSAKLNGDFLVVALNSDEWLIKKKGKFFMPFSERKSVIQNLNAVDKVIDFKDDSKGINLSHISYHEPHPLENLIILRLVLKDSDKTDFESYKTEASRLLIQYLPETS